MLWYCISHKKRIASLHSRPAQPNLKGSFCKI
nr:MAG TPA: hypothetical protein [Caudoviricetes sp.]